MKNFIFLEILNRIRSKPNLKKNLKIFAIVGVFGFVITSALVIWAGVSTVRFANAQIQTVDVKGQSLMNIEAWTAKPLTDTFNNLKIACLEAKPPICEGSTCQEMKMRMNTAKKGETI